MLLTEYIEAIDDNTENLYIIIKGKNSQYKFAYCGMSGYFLDAECADAFCIAIDKTKVDYIKNDLKNGQVIVEVSFVKEFVPKNFKHTVTYEVNASSDAEKDFLFLEASGMLEDLEYDKERWWLD